MSGLCTGCPAAARKTDPENEIIRRFGVESIVQVPGPAGTAFRADVHGIHAGPVSKHSRWLMVEIGYSVLPVCALLYRPMRVRTPPQLDAYINQLLVHSGAS